jgi:hypothetical protein
MATLRQFKNLGALLLGLSVFGSAGGHLFALQSVAWASMLWTNVQHDSALVAVKKTFDGQHPCGRCHEIASAQARHASIPAHELARRFDPACLQPASFEARAWHLGNLPSFPPAVPASFFRYAPPTPPPRSVALPA